MPETGVGGWLGQIPILCRKISTNVTWVFFNIDRRILTTVELWFLATWPADVIEVERWKTRLQKKFHSVLTGLGWVFPWRTCLPWVAGG